MLRFPMRHRSSALIVTCAWLLLLWLRATAVQVVAAPRQPDASPPTWTVECVDCPRFFDNVTARSLRLDPADRPHLAYGGDALYHAFAAGAGWQIETVDSAPGVGEYAALAVYSDTLAIAYYDKPNADLRVARRENGLWQVATVDAAGSVGTHTAAAFDALGALHVAYFDATNLDLKLATWNGVVWGIETVESQQTSGTFASLAIDGNNRPHISYIQYVSGSPTPYVVRYAAFDGTTWQFDSAEASAVPLLYTSLALDTNDRPVIAYQNAQNGVLHVTSRDAGGAWSDVAVTPAGDINNGAWPSLAIDANGQFHVAYQGASSARYAYTDPVLGWQLGMIDVSPNSGAFSSLALDSSGTPHITYGYNSAYNGDLRYAHKVSGAWQVQTLDHREDPGSRAALTIDGQGQPHIAYKVDYTGRSLRYTTFQTPTGWLSTTVDLRLAGFAGDYVSVRTDAAGQPRIGYYGGTYGGLRYSELTGTTWISVTIVGDLQTNMTGRNTSLALATDGAPHLGYAGVTSLAQIGYAKRVAGAWQTQNVEGFGGCGYTALALTGADAPRLAYCFGNTVRYTAWNGAAWVKSSVVTTTLPPAHIDLALDGADTPHISYQDPVAANLHYATLQGGAWLTETVDPAANTGLYSAITVNLSGTLYISYYDQGAQRLNVAWRTPSGWVTQTVVSGVGVLTAKTTLAAAPTGAIGIAYYDAWRHDLKLAASGVFTSSSGGEGGGGGGGVVTDCTNADDFLAKVDGGGSVTFACDGVLVIPEVSITATTVISATGRDVTLTGDGANRLLTVQPGAMLALHHLKLTGGVAAEAGGAIRIAPGAAVTITQSTLYNNRALAGGALANDGGWLYVENSTISGNHATGTSATQGGGAIVQTQSGAITPTTTLRYSTFHSNTVAAGNPAAGGLYPQAGGVIVEATILDDPVPCSRSDATPGAIQSAGYNLENADACGLHQSSDLTNTLPMLGSLSFGQDTVNGARVLVHTPPFNSAAVDSIPAAQCTVAVDQQDVTRPQEGEGVPPAACDRGAVERLDSEIVQTTPYTVNDDGDDDDGRCTVGHCTLREAIVSANTTVTTSVQAIRFNFGDAAPHAIVVTASLPAISTPLTIDGLSAPGASCAAWPPTLQVVISGAGAGAGVDGLRLSALDSSVRGLVINGFGGAGVRIDGARNRVECNYIGTNAAGTAAVANAIGVQVRGGVSNTIGGGATNARNLIAGNGGAGVHIAPGATGSDSRDNRVQGNYIGVQADGVAPLGNGQDGVTLDATDGVRAAAAAATVASNLVGGEDAATGNRIVFNGGNGVTVRGGGDNRLTANIIYSNTLVGIALADGGNHLQPAPVISAAVNPSATATTLITLTLNATPDTLHRLELFANPACDASGAGEGAQRIDAVDVTTTGSGEITLLRTLPQLPLGAAVTATATRLTAPAADGQRYGDTSAFSVCRLVVAEEQPPTPPLAAQFLPLVLR